MRTYKNIYFTAKKPIAEVIDKISASLSNGWLRDEDSERRSRQIGGGEESYYFYCDKRDARSAAIVVIMAKGEDRYWLSHVIPTDDSPDSFDEDQFDAIVSEFANCFLRPLEAKESIFILEFEGELDMSIELGVRVYDKLVAFSSLANKSTGSREANDRSRWFDFIVSFYRSENTLPAPILKRWLVEEAGWSDSVADELESEFEFGVGLLAHAKKG